LVDIFYPSVETVFSREGVFQQPHLLTSRPLAQSNLRETVKEPRSNSVAFSFPWRVYFSLFPEPISSESLYNGIAHTFSRHGGFCMKFRLHLKALRNKLKYAAALLMLVPCALGASNFQNLYSFTGGNDGRTPTAGLLADGNGNFYGTTPNGGGDGCGAVYELSHTRGVWRETVLYSFTCGSDGEHPIGGLVLDQTGNLYGATSGYSTVNYGNAFELVRQEDGSWSLKVLYSFSGGSDGRYPAAGLTWDQSGNLYGTTTNTGLVTLRGLVFQLRPSGGSWKERVLHRFAGGSDGDTPSSTLTFDSAGNMYGTTLYGGGRGYGTIFQLNPQQNGSWKYRVIHRFRGTDGDYPVASVILDAKGNLYGTASGGGPQGSGAVFELIRGQKGSWTEKSLHNFGLNPLSGIGPQSGLLFDTSGNLWGTTLGGGNLGCKGGCGVVFELTPNSHDTWKESVMHTFVDEPSSYPAGTLISDPMGNLYGTTEGDGTFTFGSIYELTP
jgi:uncharacterized repeat protein (TIGR03803 family)